MRPIAELLDKAGVRYKSKRSPRGGVWHNFQTCPCCGHRGAQCGVHEAEAPHGRLVHRIKCWHPHDNPWGNDSPLYVDFLRHIGVWEETSPTKERLRIIEGGAPADEDAHAPGEETQGALPRTDRPGERLRAGRGTGGVFSLAKPGRFIRERMSRLRRNEQAMAYLTARGLTSETIERFMLGLTTPYTLSDGVDRADALMYPVINADGSYAKRCGNYVVPGVTVGVPEGVDNGWMAGAAMTCYSAPAASTRQCMIVEGAKDLWRLWQALSDWGIRDLVLITSTHGSAIPAEWRDPRFWSRWDTVYLGQDADAAGDRMARQVADLLPVQGRRVRIDLDADQGKDWTDWLNRPEADVAAFQRLLDDAPVQQGTGAKADPHRIDLDPGSYSFEPIDIASAYRNGFLYTTVDKVIVDVDEDGERIEYLDTIVVRSDGTIHRARRTKAPEGRRPVLRLYPDGALLKAAPATSPYQTWKVPSIEAFCAAGGRPRVRSLRALLNDIERHLRARVWLPRDDDYAILAAVCMITYCQTVFDAVPLLLTTGPFGSGKSALGKAMIRLCANAAMAPQVSAASVARLINASRGFVVLDDLEIIASKSGEEQFTQLIQALKVSYSKETGIKLWTDAKNNFALKDLNFYGVKLINNTRGADAILSSRMIRIRTLKLTRRQMQKMGGKLPDPPQTSSDDLRQELHTWTFANVQRIADQYEKMMGGKTDRSEEIAAPVLTIAHLAQDQVFLSRVVRALERNERGEVSFDDPDDVLTEVAETMVVTERQYWFSSNEVAERVKQQLSGYSTMPEWCEPAPIGRRLVSLDIIDTEDADRCRRVRVDGRQVRRYPVTATFLKLVLERHGVDPETLDSADAKEILALASISRSGTVPMRRAAPEPLRG